MANVTTKLQLLITLSTNVRVLMFKNQCKHKLNNIKTNYKVDEGMDALVRLKELNEKILTRNSTHASQNNDNGRL